MNKMKTLTADKVKDGFLVVIKDTVHLKTESEVLKIIKQKGLVLQGKTVDDIGNLTIIAN